MQKQILTVYICIVYTMVLLQDLSATTTKNLNTNQRVEIDGKTYFFGPNNLHVSTEEAYSRCSTEGMVMISFETKSEWDKVTEWMDINGYSGLNHWTSGRLENGVYKWASGIQFTYDEWAENQPDTNSTCVSFMSNYGWSDEGCINGHRYVCELEA